MTKDENASGIPAFVRGDRRLFYVNRENPGPSFLKTSLAVLKRGGIVGTAWEGTRFGRKNEDPDDILTLGPAHEGIVLIATRARVPILTAVVMGTEKILPRLDLIYKQSGIPGVLTAMGKALMAKDKPELYVGFSKPYEDHILPEGQKLSGTDLVKYSQLHTDRIIREQAIPIILKYNPEYPLGPYAHQTQV